MSAKPLLEHSAVPNPISAPAAGAQTPNASTALVDSAPVAIYHYSGQSAPLYVNRAFREMFGMGAEQSPDVWIQNVHPQDRAKVVNVRHKGATNFRHIGASC